MNKHSTEIGGDPYVDVARWMQEIGARAGRSPDRTLPPVSNSRKVAAAPRRSSGRTLLRDALALAALSLAYLQYHFLGVQVQIALIHSVIVFVFPFAA